MRHISYGGLPKVKAKFVPGTPVLQKTREDEFRIKTLGFPDIDVIGVVLSTDYQGFCYVKWDSGVDRHKHQDNLKLAKGHILKSILDKTE